MGSEHRKATSDYKQFLPSVIYAPSDGPCLYKEEPTRARLWARYAWFSEKYTVEEIAEEIGVTTNQIKAWIRGSQAFKGWAEERESADKRIVSRAVHNNAKRLSYLMDKMLTVLEASTQNIIDNRHMLTVNEYDKFVGAFEKVYKTRQLELGRPTEILEDGSKITWESIRKRLEEVDIIDYKKVAGIKPDVVIEKENV